MFQINEPTNNKDGTFQITLEGTSFYFMHRIPVAFRNAGEAIIWAKENKRQYKPHAIFYRSLGFIARVVEVKPEDFKVRLEVAYKRAIISGFNKIKDEVFSIEPVEFKEKGKQNVTVNKSYTGLSQN